MSFGKSRARLLNQAQNKVTFDDVAGVEESKEELQEVVVAELTAAWEHVKEDASARTQAFWARHWPLICGVALPCVVGPAVVCVKILRM